MFEILKQIQSAYLMGDNAAIFNMLPDLMDSVGKTVVELPCKVGDAVWIDRETFYIHPLTRIRDKYIKAEVLSIKIGRKQTLIKVLPLTPDYMNKKGYPQYPLSAFGKTIFLTKAEAEAELEKRNTHEKT
jgi:hypothetical protein